MKTLIILFSLIAIALLLISCRKDDPIQPQPPTPGKRDYVWNLYNFKYPGSYQTNMRSIWASSPKDVYIVGHTDESPTGAMYHYDGDRWSPVTLSVRDGGLISGFVDFSSVYGFSPKDIWAVGAKAYLGPPPNYNYIDSSIIIHWDGTAWREFPIKRGRSLYTIWSSSPNDIWTGGGYGTLYHYNGVAWIKLPFDTLFYFNNLSGFNSDDIYSTCGKLIDAVQPYDSSQYFLYHYNGMQWSPLDSFMVTVDHPDWKFGLNLWSTDKLYASTYGVYLWQKSGWKQLFYNDWPLHIGGSSNENIFAVGDLGRIFEWNGTDWKQFTDIEYPNIQWTGVWTNNVETFIVGNDGMTSYIMHGK